jgi:small subunit ribosomal protein S4
LKLFLKGDRCFTDKCAFERRPYPPGKQSTRRPKHSDYGIQLREKQKVRRIYGIMERQFRIYFKKADRLKGKTGENLLILLERRLDNIVYRLGYSVTRNESRILVGHGHFLVNGKKVTIPSYLVKSGDVVELREKSRKIERVNEALDSIIRKGIPEWLELKRDEFKGIIKEFPRREDITEPIQEQLIVELYSK